MRGSRGAPDQGSRAEHAAERPATPTQADSPTKETTVSDYEQKMVQYLEEAHATEVSLTRVLENHIGMTPEGSMRAALQQHLGETRSHADRVRSRIDALTSGARGNPLQAWVGLTETIVGQAVALSKAPLDALRGTGGEEKVLKNAKDDCATEALEIATYTAIEQLARDRKSVV
jgi:ferritin-like metal-binding protein YciE